MEEKQKSYFHALDGLRAISILFVCWFHIWQQSWLFPPKLTLGSMDLSLDPPVVCGYLFVEVLFVLSGFLLFYPFADGSKISILSFYKKRAIRILPSYYLCLLICGLLLFRSYRWQDWIQYFAHQALFLNSAFSSTMYHSFNGVLWSTAIEVQFYLLFPFIAKCMQKKPALTMILAFLVGYLSRKWVLEYAFEDRAFYMNQLFTLIDCFVGGMFTAKVCHILQNAEHPIQESLKKIAPALFLLSTYLLIHILLENYQLRYEENGVQYPQIAYRGVWVLASMLLIFSLSIQNHILEKILGNRVFHFIGGISYQMYLWHAFFIVRLRALNIPSFIGNDPHNDPVWQNQYFALCWIGSILLAVFFTYAFEKPITKLLLKKRQTLPKYKEQSL